MFQRKINVRKPDDATVPLLDQQAEPSLKDLSAQSRALAKKPEKSKKLITKEEAFQAIHPRSARSFDFRPCFRADHSDQCGRTCERCPGSFGARRHGHHH